MGYRHLHSVPPGCRTLRSVLDFCTFCRQDRTRIYHRIVVRFTHSSRRSSITHLKFGQRVYGMAYTDVLHVYGISRAGYIPQMSTFRLPNPAVIFELLRRAGARALVYAPSSDVDLLGCTVPAYPAIQIAKRDVADVALPPLRTDCSASDLVFVLHTSGSTGGSPKLVPCNRRWLDNVIMKAKHISQVPSTRDQDVTVAM